MRRRCPDGVASGFEGAKEIAPMDEIGWLSKIGSCNAAIGGLPYPANTNSKTLRLAFNTAYGNAAPAPVRPDHPQAQTVITIEMSCWEAHKRTKSVQSGMKRTREDFFA